MGINGNHKSLILKGRNGGRSRARTVERLLVSSTVIPYIADSYGGLTSFLWRLCVSRALIAQHFEQQFAPPGPTAFGTARCASLSVGIPVPTVIGTRGIPAATVAR